LAALLRHQWLLHLPKSFSIRREFDIFHGQIHLMQAGVQKVLLDVVGAGPWKRVLLRRERGPVSARAEGQLVDWLEAQRRDAWSVAANAFGQREFKVSWLELAGVPCAVHILLVFFMNKRVFRSLSE